MSLNFGFNVGVRIGHHRHPNTVETAELLHECIHFLGPLCIIQELYFGLGTADFFAFISYQDILTTRLPTFLMQYHVRVIYLKLRALCNVSSKVEIFTYVRAEVSRPVCPCIPSSLPSSTPRTGSTVVSTLRRNISDTEQKNLITRGSYVLHSTDYRLQLELCCK